MRAEGPVCATCGDVGERWRVVERQGGDAVVERAGARRVIDVSLVPARVGDWVLVHAGVALACLSDEEGTREPSAVS
jgi:hydrogenase expression/formation protein HypC